MILYAHVPYNPLQITSKENQMDEFRPDPVLLFEIESLDRQVSQVKEIAFSGVINYPVINIK